MADLIKEPLFRCDIVIANSDSHGYDRAAKFCHSLEQAKEINFSRQPGEDL